MNEIRIQCPCGQENELIESPEGLRYNAKRHGNGELCGGKCFNCHAILKEVELEKPVQKPESKAGLEPAPAAKPLEKGKAKNKAK